MPTLAEWCACKTSDGLPLPTEKCNRYRINHGLLPLDDPAASPDDVPQNEHLNLVATEIVNESVTWAQPWSPSQPSRGFGDTIAKITSAIGVKPRGGCKKRQKTLNWLFPFAYRENGAPPFVTTAQLMADAKLLASKLPADTSEIIGIARSGLCVATMVAMLLHRPLSILRQSANDIVPAGNGWRLTGVLGHGSGTIVVIDDTVMTGNSFKNVMPIVRERYPNALTAAVYVNPAANQKPDLWVRELPWPHLLEWNLFNSVLSPQVATDFDGILCHDCPPLDDDDGTKYAGFLAETRPLYYSRKTPIPLIVTSRLEKYRPQTLDWLRRHGMHAIQLVMGPWSDNRERARSDVAAFKAQHFVEFLRRPHPLKPPMFIESDPGQAQRIAELSKGIVVCPAAGRCF